MKDERKTKRELIEELTELRGRVAKSGTTRPGRTRTKKEPAASSDFLSWILDGIFDAVLVIDRDYKIREVNGRFVERYGGTRGSIIGRKCYDYTHGKKRPCRGRNHVCPLKEVLEKRGQVAVEHVHSDAEGNDLIIEITAFPILNGAGEVEYVAEVNRDVTERRQAEEALEESEKRYRVLVETLQEGIALVDANENIVFANPAFCNMLGYTQEEIEGVNLLELVPKGEFSGILEAAAKKEKGTSERYELTMLAKDGEPKYVNVSVAPWFGKDGGFLGAVVVVLDITGRVNAEEELRGEKEKAQQYLEIAGVMFVVFGADCKVRMINRKGCELLGYGENDIVGEDWFDNFVPETVRADMRSRFGKLMTGKKEPEGYFENPVLTKDGEERTVLWHTTVLKDENGNVVGALSSGEDVTERKLAEKALEREHFAFKIIAEAAVNAADVNDLCGRVLTGLVDTLGFDAGTFRLYDDAAGVLWLVASFGMRGKEKELSGISQRVDDPSSIIAFVARSRKPLITPDGSNEELLKPFKSRLGQFKEQSLIFWPVMGAGGDVLGVLHLWSRKQLDISEEDRAFFERVAGMFASVLERKQTEEALRESEERIRQFAETVPDILYKFNQRECRYDFLSPAFERMTGYPLSEIHADPCDFQLKLVHPDDVIRIMKTINEYASGGPKDEPLVTETRLIKADGEIVWVRDSILYEWDEEGLSSVIGVMSDITERKRSEKALRESEERFRRFTNTVTDMIYRFDVGRHKYDFISPSCETITGYTADEFNADPTNLWESLIHPEDVERVKKEIGEQLAGERPLNFYSLEYRIVRKDGEVIWVNEQGNFEVDGKGTITNFNGVVRNITERRRADEEIRKLTQFLDLVIDDANVWLNVVDNDGNVLVWNKAAEEITGYSRDEVIGSADVWSDLFPDDEYRKEFIEKFNKATRESEDANDYDITVRTRNGEVKVISWSTRSLSDKKGQYLGTVALGFDITGRKRAEEEFIKASKMESLSLLAGGIAHDFRNLLSVILGNISYVKSTARLEDEQFVEALSDAEDASYQAKDLTDRLLTFSKGGVPIKETLDVGKLVEESATFAVHGSNVRTVFNIPDDLWVIEADNSQIRQVVNNIVINAVQAMPKGGDVNIRCENTLVKAGRSKKIGLPEGKYVKITLKDSGTGISKENESKIFDPFFTTKYEGTGLGLSTSYSIIKNHNGLITVDSKLGSGSTFEVYLPALEGEPEFRETYNEEFYQGKGKILVMDDEKGVRDLLNKVFTRAGYEVVCAEDGTKALKTYKKAASSGEPFDLVILDLTVPAGMGGKETVRELIRFDPDVKAIVASGYSNDPVLSNFEQYGFRGSVKKPFSISILTRTVRDVIQGV